MTIYNISIRPVNGDICYTGSELNDEFGSMRQMIAHAFRAAKLIGGGRSYDSIYAKYFPAGKGDGEGTWHVQPARSIQGDATLTLGNTYIVHVSRQNKEHTS